VREWLIAVTERTVVVIDAMALLIVVVGTVVAFVAAVRAFFAPLPGRERRTVWLNYARWLVAGLTFQLAADINRVIDHGRLAGDRAAGRGRGDPHVPRLLPRARPERDP
jgi:uncharacterized membrane protein